MVNCGLIMICMRGWKFVGTVFFYIPLCELEISDGGWYIIVFSKINERNFQPLGFSITWNKFWNGIMVKMKFRKQFESFIKVWKPREVWIFDVWLRVWFRDVCDFGKWSKKNGNRFVSE